jgi:hypothetical protein
LLDASTSTKKHRGELLRAAEDALMQRFEVVGFGDSHKIFLPDPGIH